MSKKKHECTRGVYSLALQFSKGQEKWEIHSDIMDRSQNGASVKACWVKEFDRKVLEDVADREKMWGQVCEGSFGQHDAGKERKRRSWDKRWTQEPAL